MSGRRRPTRAARFAAAAILALSVAALDVIAQSRPELLAGRRVEEALRLLQARGLRIVFTSELVTPDLRVQSEPKEQSAREQLAELLKPHGLVAEPGPGGVLQVVRDRRSRAARPPGDSPTRQKVRSAERPESRGTAAVYEEQVTVTATPPGFNAAHAGGIRSVGPRELREFGSDLADDPLRVVQSLPGVAAGDDFRSEYSVRGSAYRHASVVVDGVLAPWLQHAAPGRADTATMTMIRGEVIGDAALLVGAYPRRDSGQLGPQLNLSLREGSRTVRRFQAGVSGTAATFTAEGPLGSAGRGSWLAGARRSHVEWPVGRSDHQSTVFGYTDAQSKLVYDPRPGQQIGLSVVAGLSNVERDNPNPRAPADGHNRAALIGFSWRHVAGSRALVTHRVSTVTHDFVDRDRAARPSSQGANSAQAYRVDVSGVLLHGLIETGGQVRRVHGLRRDSALDDVDVRWVERSGYASFRRAVAPGVTLVAGLRHADSTLVRQRATDRWLQVDWAAGPRWLVHGSTGVMHQFPAIDDVGGARVARVRPERAAYVDLGVGHQPSAGVRWDATVFLRRERDVLHHVEHALTGFARGIELTVEGRTRTGLTGWAAYSYGVARQADAARQLTFPADFDQRHAVNLSGGVALPWKARARLTFRGGTNFPIPGYLAARGGRLFESDRPNAVRLPAYGRLDVHLERTFTHASRRFTAFVETLNVLNRVNIGLAEGSIVGDTREAVGFTERLFPRLVTAGLRIGF